MTNHDDDACTDLACSVNQEDHSGFTLGLPPVDAGATVESGPVDVATDSDGYATLRLRWWDPDFGQFHYSEPLRLHAPATFGFDIPRSSGRRVLIVAPHPDDETLGTGGVIYHALHGNHANHARVRVIISTNGDAYTSAVSNYYYGNQSHTPTALDFRNSGLVRRGESLDAMGRLGLTDPDDVLFLNYPDQGMRRLFVTNYDVVGAWTSTYTQRNEKYDPGAFRRDADPASAKYAGTNVHQDLVAIISDFQPTEVYVTDPRDTHGDHAYLYLFLDEAVRAAAALPATLYRAMIHAPAQATEWPNPNFDGVREHRCTPLLGLSKPDVMPTPDAVFDFAMMPPESPMRRSDATNLKRRAIDCYKSQIGWYYNGGVLVPSTAIDARGYLIAFAKSNELFWARGYDGPDANDWASSPGVFALADLASGQLSRQALTSVTPIQQDVHDVWTLAVPTPGRVRVRMDVVGSNLGLRLYDQDGATLLASFEQPGATEQLEYVFRTAGTYFVEAFIQGGGSGGTYSFHDQVLSPPPLGDYDWDWDVDGDDFELLAACLLGPAIPYVNPPPSSDCTLTPDEAGYLPADFDRDGDLDQDDFGVFQRCYSGQGRAADPACAG